MIYGMGDALNGRAFLVTYCKQKNIQPRDISIYTEKYWWMFEDLGFKRGTNKYNFLGLTAYRNFGRYNLPKFFNPTKLDRVIAMNAGIDYNFDVCVPLPRYTRPSVKLPKRFITFNTGYGDLSGNPDNKDMICLKAWPNKYWEEFVKNVSDMPIPAKGRNSDEREAEKRKSILNQYMYYVRACDKETDSVSSVRDFYNAKIEKGKPSSINFKPIPTCDALIKITAKP